MTAPDWVPLMRRAAAIVTDSGGMTCHAAIVSRELGHPLRRRHRRRDDEAPRRRARHRRRPRGRRPRGRVEAPAEAAPARAPAAAAAAPVTATKLLVNLSEPSQVERAAALDVDGVGLLRAELMVLEALEGAHPRLLLEQGRGEEFVERMADGADDVRRRLRAAADHLPDDRLPHERVPRPGGRRALRARGGQPDDRLPRRAALHARARPASRSSSTRSAGSGTTGHTNLHVMLPFVRTARELAAARERRRGAGLLDRPGFELWVMAEVPSVLFNLERYAELGVAGISIGSNDLTQLLLGADRDSELLAEIFDERDPAVADYLRQLIPRARAARAADVDLRPGAVGPPRVRGPARARGDRRDLGQHRRRRPRAAARRRGRDRVLLEAARADARRRP